MNFADAIVIARRATLDKAIPIENTGWNIHKTRGSLIRFLDMDRHVALGVPRGDSTIVIANPVVDGGGNPAQNNLDGTSANKKPMLNELSMG